MECDVFDIGETEDRNNLQPVLTAQRQVASKELAMELPHSLSFFVVSRLHFWLWSKYNDHYANSLQPVLEAWNRFWNIVFSQIPLQTQDC